MAGALKDYKRGIVFGETSYGKGSVQSLFDLSNNGLVKITTAYYFTPENHKVHDAGIVPDISPSKKHKTSKAVMETLDIKTLNESWLNEAIYILGKTEKQSE